MKGREICPLCHQAGVQSFLKSYQINLDEAVFLCENSQCPYPLASGTSVTYNRSLADVPSGKITQQNIGLCNVTQDLQARVAAHMKKMGHRLQKDAIGIQTGSPQLMKGFRTSKGRHSQLSNRSHPPSHRNLPGRFLSKNGFTGSQENLQCQSNRNSPVQNGGNSVALNGFQSSSQSLCGTRNGYHNMQTGSCNLQTESQPCVNGSNVSYSHSHTAQGSVTQSFSRIQSFSRTESGASQRPAWSSCTGSEGNSDKDSLLNSSLDSVDSHSSAGSSHSAGEGKISKSVSRYPAFEFGKSRKKDVQNSGNVNKDLKRGHECSAVEKSLRPGSSCIKASSTNVADGMKYKCDVESYVNTGMSDLSAKCEHNGIFCNSSVSRKTDDTDCKIDKEIHGNLKTNAKIMLNYPPVFPQWRNRDALCWLDVILCLTVHNQTLKSHVFSDSCDKTNIICRLFDAHGQASRLLEKLNSADRPASQASRCSPETNQKEAAAETIQDGENKQNNLEQKQAPLSSDNSNPTPIEDSSSANCMEVRQEVRHLLDSVRENIWEGLQMRLKCERGQHESPVFAFPLLLKENPAVDQMFRMEYRFEYECTACGHSETTEHSNTLPTFPAVVSDFSFTRPEHLKTCPKCGSTKDPRTMAYKRLPRCLLMHFTEGLSPLTLSALQTGFRFSGYWYTITGLVQYVKHPDHFIAWLRNPLDNKWMKCDDLQKTACRYDEEDPVFPTSQIHIIMWERVPRNMNPCLHQQALVCQKSPEEQGFIKALGTENQMVPGNLKCQPDSSEVYTKTACNLKSEFESANRIDARNTLVGKEQVKKPSLLTQVKKLDGALMSAESSPCSTLSADSETVVLPTFVASTPVSSAVCKPVPKPVLSITGGIQQDSVNVTKGVPDDSNSKNQKNDICCNNEVHLNSDAQLAEVSAAEQTSVGFACSQIGGEKPVIQPSTVFCAPKSSRTTVSVASSTKGKPNVSEGMEISRNILDNPDINSTHVEQKMAITEDGSGKKGDIISSGVQNENETVVGSTAVLPRKSASLVKTERKSMRDNNKSSKSPYKDIPDKLINDDEMKQIGRNNSEKTEDVGEHSRSVVDRSSSLSRLSVHTKFKLPIAKSSSRYSSVARDAFFTLGNEQKQKTNSVTRTTESRMSSAAWGGKMTVLDSVKQYLLNRTMGKTEHKFEGLNLKSAPRTNLTSLSELNSPVTSSVSGGKVESPMSNVSVDNSSRLSIQKFADAVSQNSSLRPSSGASNKPTEMLHSVGTTLKPQRAYMKRKHETGCAKTSVNKWLDDNINSLNSDQLSQKENASRMTLRKRDPGIRYYRQIPGGKKMKLIKELADKSENLFDQTVQYSSPVKKSGDMSMDTKCEADNVLQDLYEALNIPFSSVSTTMSDILTDVDDILDFVSMNDVLPGQQRSSTPLSYADISPRKSLTDCWKRRPGRNSA